MASKKRSVRAGSKTVSAGAANRLDAFANVWTGVIPGTPAEVSAVETALGVQIPDALSGFLVTCAFGKPERPFYYSARHRVEVGMGRILPLKDQPKVSGIVAAALVRRRVIGLPEHLVPFAVDNGNSDVICVDSKSQSVIYWVHDEVPSERGRIVADSLQEFLSGLTDPP